MKHSIFHVWGGVSTPAVKEQRCFGKLPVQMQLMKQSMNNEMDRVQQQSATSLSIYWFLISQASEEKIGNQSQCCFVDYGMCSARQQKFQDARS